MLSFESVIRSVAWLIIGIIFGLASVIMVLASSIIFPHHKEILEISKMIDENVKVFLCIALMSAAAADFLLTGSYHAGWKICAFLFSIIALLFAYFLFNPNNTAAPDKQILDKIVTIYICLTIPFCVGLKSLLIYREKLNHKKVKFTTHLSNN